MHALVQVLVKFIQEQDYGGECCGDGDYEENSCPDLGSIAKFAEERLGRKLTDGESAALYYGWHHINIVEVLNE